MLEKLGSILAAAALSIVLIPVAIALTAVILWVASLPFRLFKATREPSTAVGIPALVLVVWSLWYGEVGFFRVMLQYGLASAIVVTIWEMRDRKKTERPDAPTGAKAAALKRSASSREATPPELTECLAEVDRAEAELGAKIIVLPRELWDGVRRLVMDVERTVHTVRVDGVSPRNLAWLLVSNVAGELVACGEHHIYRGVLSMSGHGLQQAYLRAVEELERGGFHDAAAAEKDRAWLRRRIAEAG